MFPLLSPCALLSELQRLLLESTRPTNASGIHLRTSAIAFGPTKGHQPRWTDDGDTWRSSIMLKDPWICARLSTQSSISIWPRSRAFCDCFTLGENFTQLDLNDMSCTIYILLWLTFTVLTMTFSWLDYCWSGANTALASEAAELLWTTETVWTSCNEAWLET